MTGQKDKDKDKDKRSAQADKNSIAIGNIVYTAEEVSALISQITKVRGFPAHNRTVDEPFHAHVLDTDILLTLDSGSVSK